MFFQPIRMDIDVFRNAEFAKEFTLYDSDGTVVDITDAAFVGSASSHAGQAEVAAPTVEIVDGPAGVFSVNWNGGDFAAFGSTSEVGLLVYDLKMTLDGVPYIITYGAITLIPGISA